MHQTAGTGLHDVERSAFGTLLRRFRTESGVSQEALAERAGISVQAVGALERGARRAPYRATVDLLLAALPLSPPEREQLLAAAESGRAERVRSLGSPVAVAPAVAPGGNLPFEVSSLIGREDEIALTASLVRMHRLVTLTGPGGVGKTRLALRVAAERQAQLHDGAWFVDLASLANPDLVPETAAAALGLRAAGRSTTDLLTQFLRNQHLLLVLDNCEHLIGPAARFAAEILQRCAGVCVLATSREPLGITGEITHAVPPLRVPSADEPPGAGDERHSAVALFCERARERNAQLQLDGPALVAVGEIVRRLDGIPLAIELAAARTGVLGVATLARRLDERFQLLTGGDRTRVSRQQTLRSLIGWSYDLLSAPEQRLFHALSVFAGGWTIEALEAVVAPEAMGDTLDLLSSLVDKSLVASQSATGAARYRLLESTHAYAAEKLKVSDDFDRLQDAHAAWIAAFLADSERSSETASLDVRLSAMLPELQNIRRALERCAGAGDVTRLAEIAGYLASLYYSIGLGAEARRWIQSALELLAEERFPLLAARLWTGLARVATNANDRLQAAQRAVALAESVGDEGVLAAAVDRLDVSLYVAGRTAEALAANDRALSLHRSTGKNATLHIAWSLVHRSWILIESGLLESARDALADASAMFAGLHAGREAWIAHCDLSELEFAAGDTLRALEIVDDAIPEARRLKDRERELVFSCNRAGYLVRLGEYVEAEAAAREALRIAREADDREKKLHALEHLAAALACRGEAERACTLLAFVQSDYERSGYQRETTERSSHEIGMREIERALDAQTISRLAQQGSAMSEARALLVAAGP